MAPTTLRRPYRPPVPITGHPGERIDPILQRDIAWLSETFKVKITDGYATTGHAASGEHPLGLAVDVVPDTAKGGTWEDIDRLMAWAEPKQGQPRPPFRWVGYNGDPNHGKGHHGHLSWRHDARTGRVQTIFAADGKPRVELPNGDKSTWDKITGALTTPITEVPGAVAGTAGDAASATANAIIGKIGDGLGADGNRILLYAALTIGGAALIVIGAARASGVTVPNSLAGVATLAATRNPKAAASVEAATKATT